MRLWLISQLRGSWSTVAVLEAAYARGHDPVLVHPRRFHISYSSTQGIRCIGPSGNEQLPDAAFTRMGSSSSASGLHLLRMLELSRVPCINTSSALELARDKARTAERLAAARIPMPATILLSPQTPLEAATALCGPPPWVLKLPVSTHGRGVLLINDPASLCATVEMLYTMHEEVLLQEFVEEAGASDLRLLVIGGKVAAAMRRIARKGEFRSNLHAGGRAEPVDPGPATEAIAVQAAAALGLQVAGVDMLESSRGPLVLEVNGSPGFEGLQKVARANLAELLVRLIETTIGE